MNGTIEFNVTALNEDELEESTCVSVAVTEEEWRLMLAAEPGAAVMNQDPALEELTARVQKAAYQSGWIPFQEDGEDEGFFALDFPSYIVDFPQEVVLADWRAKHEDQKP